MGLHDAEDMYRDPQHRWNHFFVDVDHPDLGRIEHPAPLQHFSKSNVAVRRPASRPSEHNTEVAIVGLSDNSPFVDHATPTFGSEADAYNASAPRGGSRA